MSLRACGLALLLFAPVGYLKAGLPGLYGYLLGSIGGSLNLVAWWFLLGLAGDVAVEAERPTTGNFLVILSFLVKLPILFALFFSTRSLGEGASSCFLLGLVLVYFALAGWSLGRTKDAPHDSNGRPH